MSISNDLVTLVEDAALLAWGRIPKTHGIASTTGIPPRNIYNIRTFCHLVRTELENQKVLNVRVVEGIAYGAEHVWLTLEESDVKMVVDVATPYGCTLYFVASDETRLFAQESSLLTYYRNISIVDATICGDVYDERGELFGVTVEEEYNPISHSLEKMIAFNSAFMCGLNVKGGDQSAKIQEEVAQSFASFLPPLPSGCPLKTNPFSLQMVYLLSRLFSHSMGITQASRNATLSLISNVDRSWSYLFGSSNLWTKHQKVLTLIHEFSSAELNNVDDACAAYQQILAAAKDVGASTYALFDESGASLSSLRLQCDWSPAFSFFFTIFDFGSSSSNQYDYTEELSEMEKVYSELFVGVLHSIAKVALAFVYEKPSSQIDNAQNLLSNEHEKVMNETGVSEGKIYTKFATAVHHYLERTRTHNSIPEFHLMLICWNVLDQCALPCLYAEYDEISLELLPESTQETEEPVNVIGLRLSFDTSGCKVTKVQGVVESVEWGEYRSDVCDLMGEEWTVNVQYAPRNRNSGDFHVFLDSLGIRHSEKVARIHEMTLFPVKAINPTMRLSVLLEPLIESFAESSNYNYGDTWTLFNERARRSVQILHCFDLEDLQTVVVPCPRSFVLQNVDPTLHVVDQWLTYFSHMPASAHRALDIQRKKFGAIFRLHAEECDLFMSVSLRPQAKFLPAPPFDLSSGEYDQRVTDLIWEWLMEEGATENVLIHVHDGIVMERALKSLRSRRSILESKHLNPLFHRLQKLFDETIHRGMVFAAEKDGLIELEIYRHCSFFFEVEYMKVIEKLRLSVEIGECTEKNGLPTLNISSGYRHVAHKKHVLSRSIIMSANDWDGGVFQFLAKWVQMHLHHAAHETLVAFQVTNAAISFLPTVPFVCRERKVYFMTSVYLHNPLGDTCNTFLSDALPVYDRDSMSYTVDLGEEFAYWFSNRAITYTTVDRDRTTLAPFTRVSGKVYVCCNGVPPAVLCKFEGDYTVGEALRGDLFVDIDAKRGKLKDELGRYEAYVTDHSSVLFNTMCVNEEPLESESAERAARAMSVAKYFQSFRGMPMHRNLLNYVSEDEYKKMVVQEYYGNTFMHPNVKSIVCRFSVAKFAMIMYGVKNTFVNAMQ